MKFSIAFALSTIASASAFAPSNGVNQRVSSSALNAVVPDRYEWKGYYTNFNDAQVLKTDADVDFDPLGFAATGSLFAMREAEIKHCRLAM